MYFTHLATCACLLLQYAMEIIANACLGLSMRHEMLESLACQHRLWAMQKAISASLTSPQCCVIDGIAGSLWAHVILAYVVQGMSIVQ